ncbi:MAG: AarF/UbiB family protein [Acidobacteriota bacterium]
MHKRKSIPSVDNQKTELIPAKQIGQVLIAKRKEPNRQIGKIQRAVNTGLNRWIKTKREFIKEASDTHLSIPTANTSKEKQTLDNLLELDEQIDVAYLNTNNNGHFSESPVAKIQASLPRRQPLKVKTSSSSIPPYMQALVFKAGSIKTFTRLLIWFSAIVRWYLHIIWDKLTGNDSLENRALRLRTIIEGVGGTAIKIGQQVSMRIDLLPYAYCAELSQMLDKVKPFPSHQAVATIERRLGRSLDEIFTAFDPEPIGSASVACVYQAILKNGEKVAVKVRRPGIGELFVADCQALSWLMRLMEYLTLVRPGLSRNFLYEFRNMLLEELDFSKEARYTDLFRRQARKRFNYFSAPRIYPELSNDEVLIGEFVSGIWLGELITAVEMNDEKVLCYLREHNIDAKTIAKRLIRANQYGIMESLFFHADPHPSNILIQPDNKLVFIDFGSCGTFIEKERKIWQQLVYYQDQDDIGHMVQCAIATLEPLPPIDIDEFAKKLEMSFWQNMNAIDSKHSKWYERTSATLWISLLNLVREYNMSMNLNTLRTIRATLLYETVAARLHNDLKLYDEIRNYYKLAGKQARKRVRKMVSKRMTRGLSNVDYLRLEQLFEMGNRIIYLTQRLLDTNPYRFSLMISKDAYVLSIIFRTTVAIIAPLFIFATYRIIFIPDFSLIDLLTIFSSPIFSKFYFLFVVLTLYLNLRRIYYRIGDKEVTRDNTTGLS